LARDEVIYYGIKIYNYKFFGIKEEIKVWAYNSIEARQALNTNILPQLPEKYAKSRVRGETVRSPVLGVTSKKDNGLKYIWVGAKTQSGWMEQNEYIEDVRRYEEEQQLKQNKKRQ
jgi:hypothetical protein